MKRNLGWALGAGLFFCTGAAFAQETGGRTDGPEGSEIGKGGYTSSTGSGVTLGVDWGASIQNTAPLGRAAGAPLFVGAHLSVAPLSSLGFEGNVQYLLNNGRLNALVGPKLILGFRPVAFYAAFKAGLIYIPDVGSRFGLSPEVGAVAWVTAHLRAGLSYAPDFAIQGDGVNQRIFLSFGYAF